MNIFDSIDTLPSVGPKIAKNIAHMCGGDRIIHMLLYFPTAIQIIYPIQFLKEITSNEYDSNDGNYLINVKVLNHKRWRKAYIISATDGVNRLEIYYFHSYKSYLEQLYPVGEYVTLWGRIIKKTRYQMVHPNVIQSNNEKILDEYINIVYPLKGISKYQWQKLISYIFESLKELEEWLPSWVIEKYSFPSFIQSLYLIHHPKDQHDFNIKASPYLRLAFDELLAHQVIIQKRRSLKIQDIHYKKQGSYTTITHLLKLLPFHLTEDQKEAVKDIVHDMQSSKAMTRILQGDVGSGKTIVAFVACLWAYESGFQSAFMAPTEILATQHYKVIEAYATKLGLKVGFLKGNEKKATRTYVLDKLHNGSIPIIVGTHALIQGDVKFKKLGLVIIDEQHRFGVEQRANLLSKGMYSDLLFTTATPIPRTLRMASMGDLDVSEIKSKPMGRKPIITKIIAQQKIDSLIEILKSKVLESEQIFWVCPRVNIDEESGLSSVEERYEFLCNIFTERQVSMVHGQMNSKKKEQNLKDFSTQKTKILVATTVIEVGIDVPTANIMIIEHAELFGLAQLHQLRGRIGRGDRTAVCFLVYKPPLSSIAMQRLTVLRSCDDGFEIAEKDWELRGSGDLLGTRQSGFIHFYCVDWAFHKYLMEDVQKIHDLSSKNEHIIESIFLSPSSTPVLQA